MGERKVEKLLKGESEKKNLSPSATSQEEQTILFNTKEGKRQSERANLSRKGRAEDFKENLAVGGRIVPQPKIKPFER